jgi:hypothetical protein
MRSPPPEAMLTRNESLSWRVLDGEAVILRADSGTLHRLNPTGTAVWERMDGTCSLHDMAQLMVAEYDVDADDAARDIGALAEELIAAGLATVGR